ncbi:uncharacterized protein BJ212DRAFT_1355185 [Suillus subaureus]|uniref:Uncharacterized protein n=1 Tax=Suillus subaureus TaxID=48587 RepID=A0A9P7JDN0_9AGAM|nr:uncharacterized protein BJ212DRAFT_1355185 [Suillus subaureus]KAG1816520.1 hypothetical protein BJ212DRAFT_1355185 [Suillus subaureus]
MVIRWVTDNCGPRFLHYHIPKSMHESFGARLCNYETNHLSGFAIVMAESPSETRST